MDYPTTRSGDTVEVVHGHRLADPYRWLEDPDSAETADWVRRQNGLSSSYLAGLPSRPWFGETMKAIVARPRAGVPWRRAGRYFVTRSDGSQNQEVWYVGDSIDELLAGGRVLLDPNSWSADGTAAIAGVTVSPDGRIAAYGVTEGGSDWTTFRLVDLPDGESVADVPIQTKFSLPEWLPDSRSYLYVDFGHDGTALGTEVEALPRAVLRLHRLGTAQSADQVVVEFPDEQDLFVWPEMMGGEEWVAVLIAQGTDRRNRLWLYPIHPTQQGSTLGVPVRVADEATAAFRPIRVDGTTLLMFTDLDAERGRVVAVDLSAPADPSRWRDVVPHGADTLLEVHGAGSGLIAVYLRDAQPRIVCLGSDGSPRGEADLPGGGLVAVHAQPGAAEFFVGLSSVADPATSYLVDSDSAAVRSLSGLVQSDTAYRPPRVSVVRRRATSADGTEIPYFLVAPTGDDVSLPAPTLIWGYGGFDIPMLADYRPGWPAWLGAGGRLVIANLRGGGEFGTAWHEGGRLAQKQNVFDDFVAVAEHLVATGVTSPAQLAMHGRSNGGLLVGAVLTQRPDLAAAAIPAVGVLDMIRFHRFTVGAAWIADYGDPEDPTQFATLLAYSPVHNVRPGTRYPATLVLTGDHDDRVVPLHSHKFTAALQAAQQGPAPVLTRIEVSGGHGLGKPTALAAAEWADLLAFAAEHTGLRPPERANSSAGAGSLRS